MTTFVAVGSDQARDYAFLTPLTCLFWRDVVGYTPIALLVGEYKEWFNFSRSEVVVNALTTQLIPIEFIGRAKNYPDATTAQNARTHVGALYGASTSNLLHEDDWFFPADADLWPLKRDFYHQHEGTDHKAVIYYANGDHFSGKDAVLERAAKGERSQTLPICHVAMRLKEWRDLYQTIPGDMQGSIEKTLAAWFANRHDPSDHSMDTWMADQQGMTEKLCAAPWFPAGVPPWDVPRAKDGVLFVPRKGHPPIDRLCRSHPHHWKNLNPSNWTDAHMLKDPAGDESWACALKLIDALMPQHSKWARQYRDTYQGAAT